MSLRLSAGFYLVYFVGSGGKVNPRNLMSVDDQFAGPTGFYLGALGSLPLF